VSYYRRPLAQGLKIRCSVCGTIQHLKYIPYRYNPNTYTCRDCAINKRRKVPNDLITVTDDLILTEAVLKRLRKKAEREIPSGIEAYRNGIGRGAFIFLVVTAFIVTPQIFDGFSLGFWLFGLFWGLGLPSFIDFVVLDRIFAKPQQERDEKVSNRIKELAEERRKEIELRRLIYSSPEWAKLRLQVIKEGDRICSICRRLITQDDDLTIDHIRPISKYPDLAYAKNNLQILCRSCNSAKGNRET